MTNDPTPRSTSAQNVPRVTVVRMRERVADALAFVLIVTGTALFLFARQSLTSLANGEYLNPVGTTFVARADAHSAQSTVGLWLVAVGLALAIGAALSHSRSRRTSVQRRLASADAR